MNSNDKPVTITARELFHDWTNWQARIKAGECVISDFTAPIKEILQRGNGNYVLWWVDDPDIPEGENWIFAQDQDIFNIKWLDKSNRPTTIRADEWPKIAADVQAGRCVVRGGIPDMRIDDVYYRLDPNTNFYHHAYCLHFHNENDLYVASDYRLNVDWLATAPSPEPVARAIRPCVNCGKPTDSTWYDSPLCPECKAKEQPPEPVAATDESELREEILCEYKNGHTLRAIRLYRKLYPDSPFDDDYIEGMLKDMRERAIHDNQDAKLARLEYENARLQYTDNVLTTTVNEQVKELARLQAERQSIIDVIPQFTDINTETHELANIVGVLGEASRNYKASTERLQDELTQARGLESMAREHATDLEVAVQNLRKLCSEAAFSLSVYLEEDDNDFPLIQQLNKAAKEGEAT